MKHRIIQQVVTILALAWLSGWLAPCAPAGTLYSQLYDGSSPGVNSQIYTDNYGAPHSYSTKAWDDFVVPVGQTWIISQVTIFGQDQGNPAQNVSVNLQFQSANTPSYFDSSKIYSGSENANPNGSTANLVFTTPITLEAGRYWISGWVERPETLGNPPGGQWFWNETDYGNPIGSDFFWQNPGTAWDTYNQIGDNTSDIQPGNNWNVDGRPADLAFQIEGIAVPEPASWCLLAIGAVCCLAGSHGKLRRKWADMKRGR
jgi:hypothetical protein